LRHFLPPCPVAAHPGGMPAPATGGSADSVGRPRGSCDGEPARRIRLGTRTGRGRSNCKSSPGSDSPRIGTDDRIPPWPALSCRHDVDERHHRQNTRPAFVPDTIWGAAPGQNLAVWSGAVLARKSAKLLAPCRHPFRLLTGTRAAPPRQRWADGGRGGAPIRVGPPPIPPPRTPHAAGFAWIPAAVETRIIPCRDRGIPQPVNPPLQAIAVAPPQAPWTKASKLINLNESDAQLPASAIIWRGER